MFDTSVRKIRRLFGRRKDILNPDEIFLDAANIPAFDTAQFEGRIAPPLGKRSVYALAALFLLVGVLFGAQTWKLQISEGEAYAALSENNRLRHAILFADRGVIYDRNGVEIAWNIPIPEEHFSARTYTELSGLAHVLGYVKFPQKDAAGFYWEEEYTPKEGIELLYNDMLTGQNGVRLIETNALGEESSESMLRPPQSGKPLTLSIDAALQSALHDSIATIAERSGFQGGAGVILDVKTGEVIALTSYPEYDTAVISRGEPAEQIAEYLSDPRTPFLNRAVSGLYAPGSIVKPFMASAALKEGIISPEKKILSTGALVIPNPYFPDKPSIFRDWKVHGWVDMRQALSVSSDEYFYQVGGGYKDQEGLGIRRINSYMRLFGFGEPTGIGFPGEPGGVIPSPEWKAEVFDGEPWLLGNTYHTSIGQYGFQITPLQAARAIAAIANGGMLVTPTFIRGEGGGGEELPFSEEDFAVVREGMRLSVVEGTALGINVSGVSVAGKTGTAQIGVNNEYINSWIIGFFPYENPRYAFAVMMERAKSGTLIGAAAATRGFFEWLKANAPHYLQP